MYEPGRLDLHRIIMHFKHAEQLHSSARLHDLDSKLVILENRIQGPSYASRYTSTVYCFLSTKGTKYREKAIYKSVFQILWTLHHIQ